MKPLPFPRRRRTGSPGSSGRANRSGVRRPPGSRRPSGRRWWFPFLAAAVAGVVLVPAGTAAAHPLGSFTVNTASVLRVQPEQVLVDVVVDMAEIPATQARPEVDAAGPDRWRADACNRVAEQATLTVDGRHRTLAAAGSALTFPPGSGGLSTLRLVCRYAASTEGAEAASIDYELRAYADRIGWREIVAIGDRMTLVASDVPASSSSGLLTTYPDDPLTSPADVRRASLAVRAGGPAAGDPLAAELGAGAGGDGASANGSRPGVDGLSARFAGLVGGESLSLGLGMVALVAAVGLGAAHAFAPGHGKTVMAARIAGGSASGRQLAAMALAVTLTHTLGVFLLAVGLSASAGFAPERLYPWLGVASGLLLVVLGLNLLRTRLGSLPGMRRRAHIARHDSNTHSHGDADSHHSHGAHSHGHGHVHSHGEDGEGFDRVVDGHGHPSGQAGGSGPQVAAGHAHGGRWHTHSYGENPPRLRDLLAVGFAGGMVPTPSAVVVLLGALALGRAWFGVLLVLAYGAGMAATLVGVGFLLDRALHPLLRRVHGVAPTLAASALRWVPVASAGVIVVVGTVLVVHSGGQVTA